MPLWELPNSSPASRRGVPWLKNTRIRALRICFFPHFQHFFSSWWGLPPHSSSCSCCPCRPGRFPPVVLVVLPVVGNHVHESKAVGGRDVVYGGTFGRIPLQAEHQLVDLALVPPLTGGGPSSRKPSLYSPRCLTRPPSTPSQERAISFVRLKNGSSPISFSGAFPTR